MKKPSKNTRKHISKKSRTSVQRGPPIPIARFPLTLVIPQALRRFPNLPPTVLHLNIIHIIEYINSKPAVADVEEAQAGPGITPLDRNGVPGSPRGSRCPPHTPCRRLSGGAQ